MTPTTVQAIGKCIVKGCKQRKRNAFDGQIVADRYGTHTKWGLQTPLGVMSPHCAWVSTNPTLGQLARDIEQTYPAGARRLESVTKIWAEAMLNYGWICLDHDRVMKIVTVRGVVNIDKTCDGRCMSATGGSCDCSCGGANHGAKFG